MSEEVAAVVARAHHREWARVFAAAAVVAACSPMAVQRAGQPPMDFAGPRLEGDRFVSFDGAEAYGSDYGSHWTPAGHRDVAERLAKFLSDSKIVQTDGASR